MDLIFDLIFPKYCNARQIWQIKISFTLKIMHISLLTKVLLKACTACRLKNKCRLGSQFLLTHRKFIVILQVPLGKFHHSAATSVTPLADISANKTRPLNYEELYLHLQWSLEYEYRIASQT